MEHLLNYYKSLRASLIISSRVAEGFFFNTAATALLTLAFVNPSITRAVVASSAAGFDAGVKMVEMSVPPPLTTLSLSSRMSLCALFVPMPFMLFILLRSSAMIAFLISSQVREDSIILAVDAPTPDTPIRSLNSSLSSLV